MSSEPRTQGLGTLFRPFDDATPTMTDQGVAPSGEHGASAHGPAGDPGTRGTRGTPGTPGPSAIRLTSSLPRSDGSARYTVQSILGRGGMGEVRLCRDDRIGREIAVKVMLPRTTAMPVAARDELRARFIREARVQGQLEHPAIVPVHEVEVLDDGTAYFTMKRVRGKTLSSVISSLAHGDADASARFTRRTLLQAFATVCLAVDFAHARGVVHRDLKPGNIMLGDFGEVYVLDWGVAKLLHSAIGDDDDDLSSPGAQRAVSEPAERVTGDVDGTLASRAGTILGTPGYMAPEQLDASRGEISPATDVYALGAILFEILTWKPVLAKQTNELELVVQTLRGVDARASVRAPERAIPEALDALCARALAVQPADRFASARALWAELDRFLEGEQDIERRRAQSTAHAQAAEKLVASARDDEDDPQRASAYGELSRALALDPDNTAARQTLLRLLTAPAPSEAALPPEIERRLHAADHETERLGSKLNAPVIVPWLASLPLALWAGVRAWPPVFMLFALIATTSAICAYLGTREKPSRVLQVAGMVITFIAYICLSGLLGPFMLGPALFSMYAVTMQTHPSVRMQRLTVALSCIAVAIAMIVEYATGASYHFDGGAMTVLPRAINLERAPTFLMVGLGTIAAIVFTTTFIARLRTRLAETERALVLQAWRLERLVPTSKTSKT